MPRAALCRSALNTMMLNMIATDALRQSAARTFPYLTEGQAPRLTERCAHKGRDLLVNP
ncbi:MAG: hypothetical protein K1V76_01900 [Candidatus Amulumruptor sp.]